MCPRKKRKRGKDRKDKDSKRGKKKRKGNECHAVRKCDETFGSANESKVVATWIDFSVRSPITGAHSITARNPASEIHHHYLLPSFFSFAPTFGRAPFAFIPLLLEYVTNLVNFCQGYGDKFRHDQFHPSTILIHSQ